MVRVSGGAKAADRVTTGQQVSIWSPRADEAWWTLHSPRVRAAALFLVDSHLWVAGAATSLTLFATHFLGLPSRPQCVLLVFAATLVIYSADSYFDRLRSRRSAATGTGGPGASARSVIVIAALAVIGWALWEAPPVAIFTVAIGGALCVAYGAPLLRFASRPAQRRRLKDIPGFKVPFVSAAITAAVIGVPLLYSGSSADPRGAVAAPASIAFLACTLFGVVLCNVCFFDIRDRHVDALSGVRTLPLLAGAHRTRQLCIGVSGLLLVLWLAAPAPAAAGPMMALLLAIVATLAYAMGLSADASRLRFAVVVDGVPFLLLAASLVGDVHPLS